MDELTHLNSSGEARMVDVGQKADTRREAVVKGRITMKPTTLEQIKTAGLKKGDALAVARVAGIMAAKKTPDLIPLCHPILIDDVTIDFDLTADDSVGITTTVRSSGKTGVEMEAMVSTSVAALTIYDMVKSVDRGITITEIYLETKKGGKSGVYQRK
ncbi:MAG: cyclic pyranopterin monophosphate synthase MoaC [Dehalococcoidales bacterium]|jgi:cyclic pyranopterin phosphate synthase|nr:cyclic pyranopterin monophosphate synthase MoaC [Dehalococcoidales bacterium]MDP6501770.1 cyclic pyranopterin monophosphate synthase MoaC [Dehalococcoidales bacterium]MDP6632327.1 cyclic pyranopterin monophosphate synthase MoaC [Dehalococcoidales bacterium]